MESGVAMLYTGHCGDAELDSDQVYMPVVKSSTCTDNQMRQLKSPDLQCLAKHVMRSQDSSYSITPQMHNHCCFY